MIELICIKCEGAMQVDDAFAGSSCRCRQCGTIQTVPKLRRNAEPARATKSLYTNLKRTGQSSSGLEALADVVASSGLSSGLPPSDDLPATTQRPSRRPIITAVVGGIVGVIATVAIMIALTRSGQTASKAVDARPAMPNPAAGRLMYCGIDIDAPVVIFVLDRGNSTRDAMGHLVNATAAAIRRLGSDRKFQVVFWDNGQSEVSYPPGGPQYATPEAVNGAIRVMDGVVAFGRTEAGSAVEKALVSRPQVAVLVTAKGTELDQVFADEIVARQKSSGGATRIHTVAIGESGDWLAKIAEATGGEHRQLSARELRDAAE